jgi:hypothetical protein
MIFVNIFAIKLAKVLLILTRYTTIIVLFCKCKSLLPLKRSAFVGSFQKRFLCTFRQTVQHMYISEFMSYGLNLSRIQHKMLYEKIRINPFFVCSAIQHLANMSGCVNIPRTKTESLGVHLLLLELLTTEPLPDEDDGHDQEEGEDRDGDGEGLPRG